MATILHGRLEENAELEAVKLQIEGRAETGAAAQRAGQREMNLRLLGQFAAVLAAAAIIACMYFL